MKVGLFTENKILSSCVAIAFPLIFIFGFYIQFHGEISPGGGFQSGIVFAIPIILYVLLFGSSTKYGQYFISSNIFRNIGCCGVILYISVGIIANILGGKFLQYSVFSSNSHLAYEIGIFSVEIGVAMSVFGAMSGIFIALYKSVIEENAQEE